MSWPQPHIESADRTLVGYRVCSSNSKDAHFLAVTSYSCINRFDSVRIHTLGNSGKRFGSKKGESRDFWWTRSCPSALSAPGGHKHDEDLLLMLLKDIFRDNTLSLPVIVLRVQLREVMAACCTVHLKRADKVIIDKSHSRGIVLFFLFSETTGEGERTQANTIELNGIEFVFYNSVVQIKSSIHSMNSIQFNLILYIAPNHNIHYLKHFTI